MTVPINHRGEEHDVHFTNYGYDPETNSHDIDWWFVKDVPCTEQESELILDQLHQIVNDPHFYDD